MPGEVSLDEAAAFADYGNAVASLCVEKRGAIPAMPTKTEIEKRRNVEGNVTPMVLKKENFK